MKTFILWHGEHDRQPTYKGVVGGSLWDQFLANAVQGYGQCWLIDAANVQEAKELVARALPSRIANVFYFGEKARAAISNGTNY
jgi:hypothetical protein